MAITGCRLARKPPNNRAIKELTQKLSVVLVVLGYQDSGGAHLGLVRWQMEPLGACRGRFAVELVPPRRREFARARP
jgi:hypothetical protein